MKLKIFISTFTAVCVVILVILNVNGMMEGNTISNQDKDNRYVVLGGPFESSGSTSRYALTESIVEDGSFIFNEERARFSSPDITKHNGSYFSLFSPGVSFIGVPFYWLGRELGMAQLFTYFSTSLLAIFNLLLIVRLSRELGADYLTSIIAGIMFLFGSNALTYSSTFTQHHTSTFFILLAIINARRERTLLNNISLGAIFGAGLLVDIPNAMIMLPVVFYVLYKQFEVRETAQVVKLKFKSNFLGLLLGLLPLIVVFGLYNYETADSYSTIAQFKGRSSDFSVQHDESQSLSTVRSDGRIHLPFYTRNQLHGFYIFLISSERSITVYNPVIYIGLIGLLISYISRKKRQFVVMIFSVILANFLLYTMFGDPTGSWAFGPRYLIPGIAIASAGIGVFLTRYKKQYSIILIFALLATYSISVSALGAMTTTQVPPRVEAENLIEPIPYTFEYNWQLITEQGINSSLFYNKFLSSKISSLNYTVLYISAILLMITTLYSFSLVGKKEDKSK